MIGYRMMHVSKAYLRRRGRQNGCCLLDPDW